MPRASLERAIMEYVAETSECALDDCNEQATLPIFLCEYHTQIHYEVICQQWHLPNDKFKKDKEIV